MTIEKGEPWGATYEGQSPDLVATDDADLARLADLHRSGGRVPILVGTGDVAATVGADPGLVAGEVEAAGHLCYPMDLGLVSLGPEPGRVDRSLPFSAHVIARRWPLRRLWPELIVMNTPLAAGLRLGPRAHPNDGRLDVTTGSLPWRQGREAFRRAVSGSHLPHPDLHHRRVSDHEYWPGHRLTVTIDGVDRGRWAWIAVSIVPDAYVLIAGSR